MKNLILSFTFFFSTNVIFAQCIAQLVPQSPTCYSYCNGSINSYPGGGTAPYAYTWTYSGGTGSSLTGLCAGVYTVTMTDAATCVVTKTVTITQPSAFSLSTSSTNSTCGNSDGSATAITSGSSGFTYSWLASGQTTATATGLAAGTYTVNVSTIYGCMQTATSIVNNTNGPVASLPSQTDVLCHGDNTGNATITTSGGTGPYTYSWSNGQSSMTASNLAAGTHTLIINDANACSTMQTVIITEPAALSASTTPSNASCSTCADGSANVTASGGTSPYTYSWSNGANSATAAGLLPGSYTVCVTDFNTCSVCVQTTVSFSTGIKDNTTELTVALYPIPVTDKLNLKMNVPSDRTSVIEVYDLLGKNVLSQKEKLSQGNNYITVDAEEFKKGVYFLKIVTSYDDTRTMKFLVQ